MKKISKNLKSFLILSSVYYEKLMNGKSISEITEELSVKECIYYYNKEINAEDLKDYVGLIEKDADVENNWYALSYAVAKYLNTINTGHKSVDNYILKMTKRD